MDSHFDEILDLIQEFDGKPVVIANQLNFLFRRRLADCRVLVKPTPHVGYSVLFEFADGEKICLNVAEHCPGEPGHNLFSWKHVLENNS